MVSVCIFALHDVMRKVHQEFQTPFNSVSHSSPSNATDTKTLQEYLETHHIQMYSPHRENNCNSIEARDLIQAGAQYANTPSAYNNFIYTRVKAKHQSTCSSLPSRSSSPSLSDTAVDCDSDEECHDIDAGADLQVEFEDLLMDEEEYPIGSDGKEYITMMREIIEELQ